MSNDMNNLLAMMAGIGKKGKSNLSGMSSMMNYMDNPFIGMLTGTYNPLSQQSQANIPESKLYNNIIGDPNAPLTLKRVAQGIVEEGQPVLKIQNEINSMVDDGVYSKDELKSWASQLAAEKADVDRAKHSASSNSVLGKAGISEYTDQYSDNPDLAPFDQQTRDYISNVKDLASKSRAKGDSLGKGFADTVYTGYDPKNLIAEFGRRGALLPSDLPGRLYKSFAEAKKNDLGLIDKATAIKLVNEMGSDRDPKKQKAVKERLFKVISSTDPKTKTRTNKQQFGDLNNPKNLAKYFEWQSAVQSANQLEKQANDYRDTTIAKAEKTGRTPAMDEMANRMLAIRLAMGQ